MIIQSTDLMLEIDTGTNAPGAILQRLTDGEWTDYLQKGQAGNLAGCYQHIAAWQVSIA